MAQKKQVNAARTVQKKKPKLGQNFLQDSGAAKKIVEALGEISGSTVIEVGPGRGALTQLLAARAGRLITIELDRMISAQLRMQYARQANVEIIEGDILQVDIASVIARRPAAVLVNRLPAKDEKHERAHVVGNLPYYITSDILLHLISAHEWLQTIVVMVQREVAERVAANPGTRDYGLLSATMQLFTRVERLFTLPPEAFAPAPKVHSTVLRLSVDPKSEKLGVDAEKFVGFLKIAFAQKRKTLVNNLKTTYGDGAIRESLKRAKARLDVRSEALSLQQMAEIYRMLRGYSPLSES